MYEWLKAFHVIAIIAWMAGRRAQADTKTPASEKAGVSQVVSQGRDTDSIAVARFVPHRLVRHRRGSVLVLRSAGPIRARGTARGHSLKVGVNDDVHYSANSSGNKVEFLGVQLALIGQLVVFRHR